MELIHNQPGTIPAQLEVDQEYLKKIVKELSFRRAMGTKGNDKARQIIEREFREIFGTHAISGRMLNILGGPVDDPSKVRIIIGAHYDSVPDTPGADDNASAVAVMLAAARAIGRREDVLFIAFNSEEIDLDGSREFASNLEVNGIKSLEQVHVLEMVGFTDHSPNSQKNPLPSFFDGDSIPTVGDFLGIVGNTKEIVDRVFSIAGIVKIPVVGVTTPPGVSIEMIESVAPNLLRSDHTSFWEKGIPATMWTDTSEFRNPNYHQPTDKPDTLDYGFMAEVTKLLVSVALKSRSQ
jgi:Zn-dependent M28 family amino/carboxypeptidase